jgi:hypothetical protein
MERGLLVNETAVAVEGDINTCHVVVYLRNISVELLDESWDQGFMNRKGGHDLSFKHVFKVVGVGSAFSCLSAQLIWQIAIAGTSNLLCSGF